MERPNNDVANDNSNVVKFEGSGEKVGFYELRDLAIKVRNILNSDADPRRNLEENSTQQAIIKEIESIQSAIVRRITELDLNRAGLPNESEFRSEVHELLRVPLTVGLGTANLDYLGILGAETEVVEYYTAKLAHSKANKLTDL